MRDTRRNENDVAGASLYGLAVLAAESQSCGATIDTERFVRRAVIMSKGIDAVAPGVAPNRSERIRARKRKRDPARPL